MSDRGVRRVADLARSWVERDGIQTMVVVVARRGRVILNEAWGRVAPEADAPPVRRDSVFDSQSIGKVFTATAVMLLVEDGLVGLNRPVSSYLPFFRGKGKDAVLIRHLLTHTSGLRAADMEGFVADRKGKSEIPPTEPGMHPLWNEYFAQRADCPLWKPPGTEMSYLGYGYELLGEIVRRVSREPLDVFCQKRIFGPLGMHNTSCCHIDFPQARRVRKPPRTGLEPDALDRARETERIAYGSGGAYTTAFDTAIFGQTFLNGGAYGDARILGPATVRAMTTNQIPGLSSHFDEQFFPEASWGLGFDVRGYKVGWNGGLESPKTFGHSGAGGVDFWVDPSLELVGVCFSAIPPERSFSPRDWAEHWRNDLFADAVTAAVVET